MSINFRPLNKFYATFDFINVVARDVNENLLTEESGAVSRDEELRLKCLIK